MVADSIDFFQCHLDESARHFNLDVSPHGDSPNEFLLVDAVAHQLPPMLSSVPPI
jgi:hypothetical protein